MWGTQLPQPILTYGVVIVMAGALIGTAGAVTVALAGFAVLFGVTYLFYAGLVTPDRAWIEEPGDYIDAVVYGMTFFILALIIGLSDKEIKRSMRRVMESEGALKRERDSLEVKVQQRTAELQKAQVEKMRELQRFAEFGRYTSTLLHDLANPLTTISFNLDQLRDGQRSKLLQRAREGLDYIEQYIAAARRQLSSQRQTTSFDVAAEVKRVVAFLSGRAAPQRVHITLKLAKGIKLHADSIRFNQVMAGLLANAIDAYDSVDNPDKVVLVVMQRRGAFIQIEVRDYGKGIPPGSIGRLFEPFYTTKTIDRGLGIGLAVVKQITEEDFSGSIAVTSSRRKGTCFTVRLPMG
jgi:signal transduction histidine kinase